jgi:23S rRNA (pseudouridine1915-N3)-methyltransferase
MRIRFVTVGKPRDEPAARLHDRYAERIGKFGVRYETSFVPDVTPGGKLRDDEVRRREAERLLAKLGGKGTLVALHREGTLFTTEQLGARLERWATPQLTLVVGGPLGLHATVLERADTVWSLSALTFPHEMVRAIVAEQLYRVLTIVRRVPYHK